VSNLTNAEFAMFCSYIAKNASAWAGDCLTLPENWGEPIKWGDVARFTDDVRKRLDRLDEKAGRAALSREGKGDG
jgi:hypothetical protein